MERVSCVGMNGSDHGANSYAKNSNPQRIVISKTRPLVEQSIIKMMSCNKSTAEQCFAIADMGCASGPNTLLSLSNIIDTIARVCQSPPELQVFVNDLPSNDFNSIFESLPEFYKRLLNMSCYVSGTPGSFYGRLFPSSSLHFVHSSYGLHWLSQVPEGVEVNKGNIHMTNTSPESVCEAYKEQFEKDFSNFLTHRAMEMKPRGGMVLAFPGNRKGLTTTTVCLVVEMLCRSLYDMVDEGEIEEGEADSFNIPHYFPSKGELKEIVEKQGSFTIDELDSFETNWDNGRDQENVLDKQTRVLNVANMTRSVLESMIASHFGEGLIQDLFARFVKRIQDNILSIEATKYYTIVISMTNK